MTYNNGDHVRAAKHAFLLLGLIAAVFLWGASAHAQSEKPKKNVLYLNSYHNGYQWSDSILEGVRSVLDESNYKIDLQIEYLDAKKYDFDSVTSMMVPLFEQKFHGDTFDVVMVSDNDAYQFALQYRDRFFPDTPLVFAGVNDLEEGAIVPRNVTGVVENFDLMLTLDVALRLHPEKRKMVVVGDESTAGLAIKRQIEAVVPMFKDRLDVEYWTHMELGEVLDRVELLPPETFLFFIPFYQTIGGKFYTAEEVVQAISDHADVPLYTAWEFLLGNGVVGGRLLSGFQHGQAAAAIALKVLSGKSADTIPIHFEPTGEYAFDYNVMERLGIDEDRLPDGSRIINAPKAFYELPKELFWTLVICFVLLMVGVFSLTLTMLERRKAESRLRDQLAFQETLMNTIPQLVSWKDAEGCYLGTNQAFAEFFAGDGEAEIAQLGSKEVMGDNEYSNWAVEADNKVIQGGEPVRRALRKLKDPEGNTAWLEVNKVPINDQMGKIVGVLSMAENVTKEHNLEKQLLQSQKMEAIGTLAGGIAHDFNNILTSIINSTELAVGDVPPHSVTGKDLRRVLKAARRGGRVVKQILAFSRPSTEGFRSIDLSSIVREVLSLMGASMPGTIAIRSHVASRLPCVFADPTQIHQVAMNLCTNAFQALRDTGGYIEIRLDETELDEETAVLAGLETGNYVRLVIEDNGPGIPMEIVDKIFDPFFTTKDKTEGTGLGLAVVHGIVKSHKGGLQVSSREGGGTVFSIYLPIAEESDRCDFEAIGLNRRARVRILFVEDDEDQLITTPRLLESMGHAVTAVGSPEEAAALVEDEPDSFDLVISDYDMPGMSGAELARTIAKAVPWLPVILVSGREDAVEAGANLPNIRLVIIKPYDKNDLTAAIGEVMHKD